MGGDRSIPISMLVVGVTTSDGESRRVIPWAYLAYLLKHSYLGEHLLRGGSSIDNGEVSSDFITRWVSRGYPPGNPIDTSYLVDWRHLNAIGGLSTLMLAVCCREFLLELESHVRKNQWGVGEGTVLPLFEKWVAPADP